MNGPAGEEGREGGVLGGFEAFDGEDVLGADAFHVLGAAVGLGREEDGGGRGVHLVFYSIIYSFIHLFSVCE